MAIKFLGISDEHTTCMACGKKNLKRTVALSFDGDVRYYGSECAAGALKTSRKVVDNRAAVLEYVQSWLGKASPAKIAQDVRINFNVTAVCKGGIMFLGAWGAVPFKQILAMQAARDVMVRCLGVWLAYGGEIGSAEHACYVAAVDEYARFYFGR